MDRRERCRGEGGPSTSLTRHRADGDYRERVHRGHKQRAKRPYWHELLSVTVTRATGLVNRSGERETMTSTVATTQVQPPPPLPPMPAPMPRRARRGPIVAAFVIGAFVVGGLAFAGSAVWAGTHDDAPPVQASDTNSGADTKYTADTTSKAHQPTSGWTSQDEQAVLTIIEAEPGL